MPPRRPCGKASALGTQILESNPACYGRVMLVTQNWCPGGCLARRLALLGQCLDWLSSSQHAVNGLNGKFGLPLLSLCGSTCFVQ